MLPPDGPSPWQCLCRCLLPGRARRPRGAWVPSVAGVGAEGAGPSQARSCRHKGLVTPSLPGASGPWVRPGDCHPLLGGGCLPGPRPSAGWGRLTAALGEPPPSPHRPGLCHESLLGPTLLPASPPALWSPTEVCESLAGFLRSQPHSSVTASRRRRLPLPSARFLPDVCALPSVLVPLPGVSGLGRGPLRQEAWRVGVLGAGPQAGWVGPTAPLLFWSVSRSWPCWQRPCSPGWPPASPLLASPRSVSPRAALGPCCIGTPLGAKLARLL